MNTPMLAFVLSRLDSSKGRWPDIARASGVPYRTVQKIAQRLIENPGIHHVQALHDHFRSLDEKAA